MSIPMVSDRLELAPYAWCMGKKTALGWGARFRHAIKGKLTLGDLAEELDMSESAIRSWVNGTREINLSDFVRLCASARLDPVMVLIEGTECSEFHDIARAWALSKDKPVERGALLLAARGILAGDDSRAANGAADARGTKPRRRL